MLDPHLSPSLTCLGLALALAFSLQAAVFGPANACGRADHALPLKFNASPGLLLQGHAQANADACSRAWSESAESEGLCPMEAKGASSGLELPGLGRLDGAALAFGSRRALWLLWLKPRGAACDWECLQLKPRPGPAERPARLPLPPGSRILSSMRLLPDGPACYCLRCPGSVERNRAWLSPQLQGLGWRSAQAAWQALPWALERAGQSLVVDLKPCSASESCLTLMATSQL